jgi:predicted phosphodiesterase
MNKGANTAILPRYGEERKRILQSAVDLYSENASQHKCARHFGIARVTFQHWLSTARGEGIFPTPKKVTPLPYEIPEGLDLGPEPIHIEGDAKALIISDVHIPYHVKSAVDVAIADGVKFGCTHVILNGDIMDCGAMSRYTKSWGDRIGWTTEKETAQAFFSALRKAFPKARIMWRPGNHERRLPAYLSNNVEALQNEPSLELRNLVGLSGYGIEWIEDNSQLSLGSLHIRHGDEWRIGAGVVSPAKIANERARGNVIIGHFHRHSEHTPRSIDDSVTGGWSTGCLCNLRPSYMPENQWVHGYALVDIDGDGFDMLNRKIIHGRAR